jgi:hypothetical protein
MKCPGLEEFLTDYNGMSLRPESGKPLVVAGRFRFTATSDKAGSITDSFDLRIEIERDFPRSVPTVFETGGKIPRTGDFHVNPNGSLCLGSHLRLKLILSNYPDLCAYTKNCIVPYLYAVSYKLQHGGTMVFSELPHGVPGEFADYRELLGLDANAGVLLSFERLGQKRRIANKLPCPCGCGHRTGICRFNRRLHALRKVACRSWYKAQVRRMSKGA